MRSGRISSCKDIAGSPRLWRCVRCPGRRVCRRPQAPVPARRARAPNRARSRRAARLPRTSSATSRCSARRSPSTVHITTVETTPGPVLDGRDASAAWRRQRLHLGRARARPSRTFHVIQGASGARVTLADQSQWEAELVGAFPDLDVAVLRIDAPRELKPLAIGTSRDLQVGQKVFAIGNPFGLDQTLTTGIISAPRPRDRRAQRAQRSAA